MATPEGHFAANTFAPLMRDVAVMLLGMPNKRLSSDDTLRWGNHGSFKVDLPDGVWHDKEANVGGGVLDLVMRERRCDKAGALAWLEGEGLIEPRETTAGQPVFYEYADESGEVLFKVERKVRNGEKTFLQHGPDGNGGFVCRKGCMQGVRRVLYRLPELIAADPSGPVFVCEGEKDVDHLASKGLVATTNPGGAGKFLREFAPMLAGRRVVVLEDNDQAGRDHAADVKAKLEGIAAEVAVLRLPGPDKGDVSDWLNNGGSAFELCRKAEEVLASANLDRAEPDLSATPFHWPNPATIPYRRWLLGFWLQRGEITAVVAPGGVGKSTFTSAIAMSVASGQAFLDKALPEGARKVWLWNLEDDREELARQITACSLLHGVGATECGNRLYVDSGLDKRLCTAVEDADGFRLIEPVYAAVKAEIEHQGIDVLIIDPFVSSHEAPENDNGKIDKVAKRWKQLASETRCAIVLVHHTKKMSGREVRAEDSRGAVALINAARSTLVLNPMSAEEAERFGITDRAEQRRLVRVDDDKPNRAPPESAWWFRKESVDLGNGNGLRTGDSVGAAAPWSPPDPFDGLCTRDLYNVQLAIHAGDYGDAVQAKDWAGHVVADVLGFNLDDDGQKARVKSLMKTWKRNGALKVEQRATSKGRDKPFVIVGDWVDPSTLPSVRNRVGDSGETGAVTPETHYPTPLSIERGGSGGVARNASNGDWGK